MSVNAARQTIIDHCNDSDGANDSDGHANKTVMLLYVTVMKKCGHAIDRYDGHAIDRRCNDSNGHDIDHRCNDSNGHAPTIGVTTVMAVLNHRCNDSNGHAIDHRCNNSHGHP